MRVPACPPRPLLCQRAARNLHLESSFQPSSSVALLESRLWTTAAFIQNSKALAPAGAAGALLQYRQDKREINFVPCFENVYVLLDDAGDSGELRRVALEARTSGARRWRRRRRLQNCNGCDPAAIAKLRYKRAITRARSRKVDAADASAAAGEPVRAVVAGDEDEQPHA